MIVINKQIWVIQTVTEQMEKERSLQSLLRDHKVSADDFFQPKGIAAQIRNTNSMARFVKYCRTHRNFATRMIYLGLNVSSKELDDIKTKKASHAITQLLANQETQLIQLFFETDQKQQGQSSEIPQELQNSIQSQAQRLFRFDSDEQQTSTPQPSRAVQITPQQLTDLTFQILKNPEKNQTCLGYLQKMFSFFIRQDPLPVLGYLEQRPEIIRLLINNLSYSSISSLLAQILTSEDKTKQYKFQNLKKNILVQTIEAIFMRLDDQLYFDGSLIFLEQILNTSKQSYYEFFQDFKRIINYLVSSSVLDRFYNQLVKLNEASFSNIAKFLESLFSRMNSEGEDSAYYQKEQSGPPMKFQVQIFMKNLSNLVNIVSRIQSFNSLTKISYLSFLQALLSSNSLKSVAYDLEDPSFIGLFQTYKNQKNGGIVKYKIYGLINKILTKSSPEQIQSFLANHNNFYQEYFGVIQSANYNNTKTYNKNEKSAFDIGLITQLTKKEDQALGKASAILGKDFKRICKKFDTKIASFQNSSSFKLEEEYNFCQFNSESANKSNGETVLPTFSLNFVGKNNISIPLLNLPQKSNTPSEESSQGRSNNDEKHQKSQNAKQPKEVFEVQQVVVLTPNIDKLQLNNLKLNLDQSTKLLHIASEQRPKVEDQKRKWQTNVAVQKKQNNFLLQIPNLKEMIDAEKKAQHNLQSGQHKKQQKAKKNNEESVSAEKSRFYARHLLIFA